MSAIVGSNQGSGGTTQFPIPEIGNYEFELIAVSDPKVEKRVYNGKEKEENRVHLDWEPQGEVEWIADDDIELRTREFVRTFFNLTLGSKEKPSNLRPYVEALLGSHGEILDDNLKYELMDYIGTRINASVKHYQKANGTYGADLVGPIPIKPKGSSGRRRAAAPSTDIPDEVDPREVSVDGPGW